MSVKLRMTRIGRHKDPIYRIVATDSRFARDGRYKEQIGYFDPVKNVVDFDENLTMKWLKAGAIASDSIKTLLIEKGIMAKFNATKKIKAKKSKVVKNHKFDKKPAPKAKKVEPKTVEVKASDIKGDK